MHIKKQYNYNKTKVLIELRQKYAITQEQASHYIGVKRDALRAWEYGYGKPLKARRFALVLYLLDKLELRHHNATFHQLWRDVMEGEWGWPPLTPLDLEKWPQLMSNMTTDDNKYTAEDLLRRQPNYIFHAPPYPNHTLFDREHLFDIVKRNLLNGQRTIAICGIPGVGKTTLANMVVHDAHILAHFKDGILWGGLGQELDPKQNTNILSLLKEWGDVLNLDPTRLQSRGTVTKQAQAIKQAIGQRAFLLIIDDAWQLDSLDIQQILGPNCACLITTRLPTLATDLADNRVIFVEELSQTNGQLLLSSLTTTSSLTDLTFTSPLREVDIIALVELVGRLPLGLVLIGNALYKATRQSRRLQDVVAQIQEDDAYLHLSRPLAQTFSHPSVPQGKEISLAMIIGSSYMFLDKQAQQALHTIIKLLPKTYRFSEQSILNQTDITTTTLDKLCDYGVLQATDDSYAIHKTIYDFVRFQ